VIGASGGDGSCLGCHAPEENHSWLPEAEVHFEKIACQACHITELFGPAIALIDDTVRDPEGNTVVVRRGQKPTGSSLAGFQPLLLQRPLDGKYAPYNVSMIRFWRDAKNNQSVAPSIINKAWQSSGLSLAAYDGHLNETEINLLKAELIALGISQPEIATRIDTAAINHGVSRDSFALKDCNTCHSDESRLQASLKLGTVNPDFVSPASIHAKGNPALNLHIDINNQLSATGVNQDIDYNLKRVHPVLAFIVGLLLLVAVLTGWQWFRNNRR
jgi:hypothetical protein